MDTSEAFEKRYDVIIVGARVAGASLALLLARAGLKVLMVDRSPPGSDTLSTHALMRGGVLQLKRWGVLDRVIEADTPAIRKTTFHYGSQRLPVPIKPRDGVDALYAPRRFLLDAILVEAAREAGATVVFRSFYRQLLRDATGRARGAIVADESGELHQVRGDIVVGADGANSAVARDAQAVELQRAESHSSVLYGYWSGLKLDGTHWYFQSESAAGAIPTNADAACVFVSMSPERLRTASGRDWPKLFRQVLRENDEQLDKQIENAPMVSKLFGFVGRPGFLRQAHGPGWALVGDSGCFKDPITAHGITDALRDSELLAQAIVSQWKDSFEAYQEERDAFARPFLDLSEKIASYAFELEEVQELHRQLSKLMNAECDFMRGFGETEARVHAEVA